MRRILVVFVALITVFSILLWIKVNEMNAARLKPAGGSAVIEGLQADATSRLAARIRRVLVEEGATVKQGDLLVELECDEQEALVEAARAGLAAAQGRAEAARAQVEAALGSANAAAASVGAAIAQRVALQSNQSVTERTVQRIDRLRGEGGATDSDLERASAQKDQLARQLEALEAQANAAQGQARAARAGAQAARAQAEAAVSAIAAAQADLKRAQALANECTLEAPISGYVEIRAFEPGEVALPGSKLVTLVRIDRVEATFYLPNRELGAVKPGLAVTASADAYPGAVFEGKIERVAAQAEFTPRNVQTREDRDRLVYAVTVSFDNPEAKLRPGMPIEVVIGGER